MFHATFPASACALQLVPTLSIDSSTILPTHHPGAQEIQALTASEPLSLAEESAMQESWRRDGDKLTFIVCKSEAETEVDSPDRDPSINAGHDGQGGPKHWDGARDVPAMVGDVNLFVSRVQQDENDGENLDDSGTGGDNASGEDVTVGELELMIAVASERGRGYGKAALLAFLRYILGHEGEILREFFDGHLRRDGVVNESKDLGTSPEKARFDYLAVKIGEANAKSIGLFEGLGFTKVKETPSFFGEFELRVAREEVLKTIQRTDIGYREVEYTSP